ncbi:MAG: NifB/NifX family molybdenum-iron cluster-binding protein [Phycisphaerae bacterium]|jgi:predicted Fe-Mo cluster-binding NifX family protein
MKVAVSLKEPKKYGQLDSHFGRCSYFAMVEISDGKIGRIEFVENLASKQAGSAGVLAAKSVIEKGVEAVITGELGPKAAEVLKQFNIPVYTASGSLPDMLAAFIAGKLKRIQ